MAYDPNVYFDTENRLTYRSQCCGDYGSTQNFEDVWDEVYALRNKLGKYEDLGYTSDEIKDMLKELQELRAKHCE